eukprot:1075_1
MKNQSNTKLKENIINESLAESDNKLNKNVKHTTSLNNEIFEILNFAWPVTLATVARISMYNIDIAFLGHLGTSQLAGASLAMMCGNVVSTFLFTPSYGLNSLCSQAIGAGNNKLAGNWLQLALLISTIMLIPTFLILFNVKLIISPFEHNENILYYASIFGQYSTCFLCVTFIYMAIRQYFQSLQIVYPATIVSIISVAINILLNQILIYGLYINHTNIHINWNGFGFIGSPLATTFSTIFQLLLFYIYAILYKKYPIKSGSWDGFTIKSFQCHRIKTFFKVIVPMMIADATENWSYQVVILLCSTLPDIDIASNSIMWSIWWILWSIFWGIGLSVIVRVGKKIANSDIYGTKLVIKVALILCLILNGIISIICFFFRREIAKIYTSSHDIILILEHSIPILCLLFFIGGIGWIGSSALEGMARNIERSWIYGITSWLIFVPLAIYFGIYSKLHNKHKYSPICLIWYIALFVEIIRCILIWIVLLRTNWRKQIILAKQRSETLQQFNTTKTLDDVKSINGTYGLLNNDYNDNWNFVDSTLFVPKDEFGWIW